jgi:D-serine deaminase-like pyridoxal phosphate-dependent protein
MTPSELTFIIGRHRSEIPTPGLILDLDVARANAELMQERFRTLSAALRPHVKVHKCPELARLQVELGAGGICTATSWEAMAMAQGGLEDILIANEVVDAAAVSTLAEVARLASVSVAADSEANVRQLSRAAVDGGVEIGVLVDVDVGMGRCGVRSPDAALALARVISSSAGLQLLGVMGYEGHCMGEPDPVVRASMAGLARAKLIDAADVLLERGLNCEVVSAGGTGTYGQTGADPRITEVQAGSYICMDVFHKPLAPEFGFALTVAGSVLSTHAEITVLNVGRKSIGTDLAVICLEDGTEARFVHEEHSGFVLPGVTVGTVVEVVPAYAPTTVNLFDVIYVVEASSVVAVWPVEARYGSATAGANTDAAISSGAGL